MRSPLPSSASARNPRSATCQLVLVICSGCCCCAGYETDCCIYNRLGRAYHPLCCWAAFHRGFRGVACLDWNDWNDHIRACAYLQMHRPQEVFDKAMRRALHDGRSPPEDEPPAANEPTTGAWVSHSALRNAQDRGETLSPAVLCPAGDAFASQQGSPVSFHEPENEDQVCLMHMNAC